MKIAFSHPKNTRFHNSFKIPFASDRLTIEYYDKIGSKQRDTVTFSQTALQRENFLKNLPFYENNADCHILDAGCGNGRDVKFFIDEGYNVDAFDASSEMTKNAAKYSKTKVHCADFLDFHCNKKYDGIYARNSFLHVPKKDMEKSLKNMVGLLKTNGILWFTLKEGKGETRDDKGRLFSYYSAHEIENLLSKIKNTSLIEIKEYENEIFKNDNRIIEVIIKKD